MPFSLLHAGTSLQKLSPSGVLATLTLPSGVTMVDTRRARFAILKSEIVVTNAVSQNIVVRPTDLVTRVLNIAGPATVPTVASGGAGDVTGVYRYKVSFAILLGTEVLTESPLSDSTEPFTAASNDIDLSSIPTSGTSGVNARRLYRTTTGGADYYLLTTIDDNTTTTYTDNTTDYDLALLPFADDLGNAPGVDGTDRLRLITSWKDRLWGASVLDPDNLRFTENRVSHAWAAANFLAIQPVGYDAIGITAIVPRRDDLVIGKRRSVSMVRGDSPSNFQIIRIFEGPGPVSTDACLTIRDVTYYLGEDGIYEIRGGTVRLISRDHVHPWFTTDTYFNRARFDDSWMQFDPLTDEIEIHIPAAGSSNVDRWINYNIARGTWRGPSETAAFTETMGALLDNSSDVQVPALGSSAGFIYLRDTAATDDDATAIDFDVTLNANPLDTPDIEKYFGELAIVSDVESAGTLTITPTVGGLGASAGTAISHSLTTGRQRLRRLGTGRYFKLRLRNNESAQRVNVHGLELPYHELGRR